MYWERREDAHNLLVSSMMTGKEFLECEKNLHLADNNFIDKEDKFGKVRPLFAAMNRQCLLNYKPS